MNEIHTNIKNKLSFFIETKKVPHIIFHGESGSGKRELLNWFVKKIYSDNKEHIKSFVMYVNCAHIKGIRFIRDELKFFAKINIQYKKGILFKSIILFNADKLTMDAQSALRRCIEQFSHTTRFFIIIENKEKLLNPILSRFCNIYIPFPIINKIHTNMHVFNKYDTSRIENKKHEYIKKQLKKKFNFNELTEIVEIFYENAISGIDLINFIEKNKNIDKIKKFHYLIFFDKIRKEFRNEKLLMYFIVYFFFLRKTEVLEI
jgi:DNA polymerase III delta prime subunit